VIRATSAWLTVRCWKWRFSIDETAPRENISSSCDPIPNNKYLSRIMDLVENFDEKQEEREDTVGVGVPV
jgi:hypothetical protein